MSFSKNILWSPFDYAESAKVAEEAGQEMLSRLNFMTLKPKVVIDMGCGIGAMSAQLNAYYADAMLIAVDLSTAMLHEAKRLKTSKQTFTCVCADAACLPFGDHSVDLIFANLIFPWYHDTKMLLREWKRVLRPSGLLMFTALGMDTLQEWKAIFAEDEIPMLVDMHDLGDWLLHEKFADPVLDVQHYTLSYEDTKLLLHELSATGMWFPKDRSVKEKLLSSFALIPPKTWEVTYELIYAHAFLSNDDESNRVLADGSVSVPISVLKQPSKKT